MERRLDRLEGLWQRRGLAPRPKGLPEFFAAFERLTMEQRHELDDLLAILERGQRQGLAGTAALTPAQEMRLFWLLERVEEASKAASEERNES